MKRTVKHLKFGKGFRVALKNERAEVAEMVIPPGDSEGDSRNRHRGADQWLFVVAGTGTALHKGVRRPLKAGSLLLIQRGETHEIKNTGKGLLKTLNVYVPPAYTKGGNPLPRARRRRNSK